MGDLFSDGKDAECGQLKVRAPTAVAVEIASIEGEVYRLVSGSGAPRGLSRHTDKPCLFAGIPQQRLSRPEYLLGGIYR